MNRILMFKWYKPQRVIMKIKYNILRKIYEGIIKI